MKSLNSEGAPFWCHKPLSNFIFSSYLLVYPEIVICLAYTSKKSEFWRPHLRETLLWYSQILSNFIFSYLSILKISSVQGEWFSFEFWRPCLRGIPSFWYYQILSNFIFVSFLPILKISSV